MIGFKPGRITLTTTSSPLFSCAAWTWAIEAEASGVLEKELNTSAMDAPSCSSISLIDCSDGKGGTWS